TFSPLLPDDSDARIYIWVRDGWTVDEGSFRADARQAGHHAPTVFVYVPRRFSDELRSAIIDYKAAVTTLDKRGVPNSPEGAEARAAMETTRLHAEQRINALLDDVLAGTRVLQGGGAEVLGNDLTAALTEAVEAGLQRLYTQFHIADSPHWDKVYARAKQGAPDALKAIGYDGEPAQQPVCKQLLAFIGPGKTGADLRSHFEAGPYGWPRDAIDGALQVLLVAGDLRAVDERSRPVGPTELDRRAAGKTTFRIESVNPSAAQRIQIRKLFQQAGIANVKSNEELAAVPDFLATLEDLAAHAGGDAPRPALPATDQLRDLRMTSGNEQLLAIYNQREELSQAITEWRDLAARIQARWPAWQTLQRLLAHADDLPDVPMIRTQRDSIVTHRQLIATQDLVQPQVDAVAQTLRAELNRLSAAYADAFAAGMARLDANADWAGLSTIEQNELLQRRHLTEEDRPRVNVGSTDAILATLDAISLSAFADRIAALSGRFDRVITDVAKLVEPETTFVALPRRTFRTAAEVDAWLDDVGSQLKQAVANGPVSLE
ncbi:MAG: hypothetical protein KDA37_12720, partial [Planctomycetales bacterium]|nr:hypothetical protein [Planctomycetales bacterium]